MQKNQNIKIILLTLFTSFLFVGCTMKNSVYTINNNVLTLGKNKDSKVSINFTNPQVQRNISTCVLDSYTLLDRNSEYGNIFIESIDLENSCDWTGSAIGFFESSLRRKLKVSLFLVEDIDYSNYNFRTYRVNGDSYLNVIYIYNSGQDKFILDYYGRLYDKVIKSFEPNFQNQYFAKKDFLGFIMKA